jgi:hypothetical protein
VVHARIGTDLLALLAAGQVDPTQLLATLWPRLFYSLFYSKLNQHVARPKDSQSGILRRATIYFVFTTSLPLKQSFRRTQRSTRYPHDHDHAHAHRATGRLRWRMEGDRRRFRERLSDDGRGPRSRQIRKYIKISKFIFYFISDRGFVQASPVELHEVLEKAREAYVYFRSVPAPRRGEVIRQIREALAAKVRFYIYYGMRAHDCSHHFLFYFGCVARWAGRARVARDG